MMQIYLRVDWSVRGGRRVKHAAVALPQDVPVFSPADFLGRSSAQRTHYGYRLGQSLPSGCTDDHVQGLALRHRGNGDGSRIGTASGRGRGGQYVEDSVVAVSLIETK